MKSSFYYDDNNTAEEGLQEGWTRWTVIIRKEYLELIRELAMQGRKTIKSIIDEAIHAYLEELMLI